MNISSPTSPKPRDKPIILLVGPPGGSKTTLLLQFPKVCLVDCDRNLDGPERFLRTKIKDLTYGYIPATFDSKGKPFPIEEIFDNIIVSVKELQNEASIETVGLDSLTLINEYIVRKVLKAQGGKSIMEAHYWGSFRSDMMKLLVQTLRGLNKTCIVTCHEVAIEKPNKQDFMNPTVIGYEPAVSSKLRHCLGGLFTDMWRLTARLGAGNKQQFRLQVVGDGMSDLKNTLSMPSEGFTWSEGELGYEKIKPYIEKGQP